MNNTKGDQDIIRFAMVACIFREAYPADYADLIHPVYLY
jgi:hypothetical protein